jgi:hypothetical protein
VGVAANHIGSQAARDVAMMVRTMWGGRGGEGGAFPSFLRAPPFPSEIFAANVFDSLGSSERLGGFVKERPKIK